MGFKYKLKALSYIIKARLQKISFPLAVRWNITRRCTSQCLYCGIGNAFLNTQETNELKTEEILPLLAQVAKCGVMRISFSGGEPMLREDIGEIIAYCDNVGIGAELNSSGKLVSSRYSELRKLSLLKLSLDGIEGMHELTKHGIKFGEVITAADKCAEQNIKFSFCTTITRYNVRYLKNILKIAKFYNTIVAFQPLQHLLESPNDVRNYYPSRSDFKYAVEMLMREKKSGNSHIRNSIIALKYIYNWPEYKKLHCWAGKVFCMIGSDGTLFPCDRLAYSSKLPNCNEVGFREAFNNLPKINECNGCGFCGTLELNFMMSFKFSGTNPIRKYIS